MIQQYKYELKAMKVKMEKAEKLSKIFPCFEEFIIENKITGDNRTIKFGERYKDMYLNWGINRYYYEDNKDISNCHEEYNGFLFNIYFNSVSIFDSYSNFGIERLKDIPGVFFFDSSNTTFYIKDEGICEFLEKANEWYLEANLKNKEDKNRLKIKNAEEQIKKAQEKLFKNLLGK